MPNKRSPAVPSCRLQVFLPLQQRSPAAHPPPLPACGPCRWTCRSWPPAIPMAVSCLGTMRPTRPIPPAAWHSRPPPLRSGAPLHHCGGRRRHHPGQLGRAVLQDEMHPMSAGMNAIGYDVWVTGNHEFNFGMDTLEAGHCPAKGQGAGGQRLCTGRHPLADGYTILNKQGSRWASSAWLPQHYPLGLKTWRAGP